jgi:hypothetical protein
LTLELINATFSEREETLGYGPLEDARHSCALEGAGRLLSSPLLLEQGPDLFPLVRGEFQILCQDGRVPDRAIPMSSQLSVVDTDYCTCKEGY